MEISSDSEDSSPERSFYRTPLNRKFQIGLKSVPVTKLTKGPLLRKPTNFNSLKTLATDEKRDMSDVSIKEK